jgi:hypothetical protein
VRAPVAQIGWISLPAPAGAVDGGTVASVSDNVLQRDAAVPGAVRRIFSSSRIRLCIGRDAHPVCSRFSALTRPMLAAPRRGAADYRPGHGFQDDHARLTGVQRPRILEVVRLKFLHLATVS